MNRTALFLILLCLGICTSAQAQTVIDGNKAEKRAVQQSEARLGIGQTLTIYPNPLDKNHAELTLSTTGIEIYSYKLMTATGQIVELESLSGRPDISTLNLNGVVETGLYVLQFETSAGWVTRKLVVY